MSPTLKYVFEQDRESINEALQAIELTLQMYTDPYALQEVIGRQVADIKALLDDSDTIGS